MKTITMMQDIDDTLNKLTEHAVTLERDNMFLKKAIRTMANKMCVDDHGNTTMNLTQEDADFLKGVCDTCDVFNAGIGKGV